MLVYKSGCQDVFGDELFLINGLLFNKLKDISITNSFRNYISNNSNRMYEHVKSIYMLSFNVYLSPFINRIYSRELLTEFFNYNIINYNDFINNQFNCPNRIDKFSTHGKYDYEIQQLFLADQDLSFPFQHSIYTFYQNKYYDNYMMIHYINELDCNEGFILINLK